MIIYTKPLQTERLILKRGKKEDYYKVYEYDFTKLRNINNEFVFVKQDLSKLDSWVLESDSNEDFADWIIYLKDGSPIGNIMADRVVPEINAIEISFNLHPDFWGNGYIKEACIEVMKYLFSLGFANILCGYSQGNFKSEKLINKIGFKYYSKKKNAWLKDGIPITDYKTIMSKEDYEKLYLNECDKKARK